MGLTAATTRPCTDTSRTRSPRTTVAILRRSIGTVMLAEAHRLNAGTSTQSTTRKPRTAVPPMMFRFLWLFGASCTSCPDVSVIFREPPKPAKVTGTFIDLGCPKNEKRLVGCGFANQLRESGTCEGYFLRETENFRSAAALIARSGSLSSTDKDSSLESLSSRIRKACQPVSLWRLYWPESSQPSSMG